MKTKSLFCLVQLFFYLDQKLSEAVSYSGDLVKLELYLFYSIQGSFFACGRTQGQISREASLKLQVGPLFHTGANVILKPLLQYKI